MNKTTFEKMGEQPSPGRLVKDGRKVGIRGLAVNFTFCVENETVIGFLIRKSVEIMSNLQRKSNMKNTYGSFVDDEGEVKRVRHTEQKGRSYGSSRASAFELIPT